MRETLELACTPCDEDCQQVGTPSYNRARAIAECRAFINQLRRQFGVEPTDSTRLIVKANPHDFGTYHEVAVCFDSDDEKAAEYAYKLEADLPSNWDNEARAELDAFDERERNALNARIAANH